MARINIDDSLLSDERMRFVIRKIGEAMAIGEWYKIARCAQKYWLDGKKPIPVDVWQISEFNEIFVLAKLVEKNRKGFYLRGSEKFFSWLVSQRENGKKGGRPKKQTKTDTCEKPTANPRLTHGEPMENPLTLTLTPSLALAPAPVPTLPLATHKETFKIPITPDELTHLFNKKFHGKLRPAIGLGSGKHFKNFLETCEILNTKQSWIDYLDCAASQDWLIEKSKVPLTLTWLVCQENALKVLEGKYTESMAQEKARTNSEIDEMLRGV